MLEVDPTEPIRVHHYESCLRDTAQLIGEFISTLSLLAPLGRTSLPQRLASDLRILRFAALPLNSLAENAYLVFAPKTASRCATILVAFRVAIRSTSSSLVAGRADEAIEHLTTARRLLEICQAVIANADEGPREPPQLEFEPIRRPSTAVILSEFDYALQRASDTIALTPPDAAARLASLYLWLRYALSAEPDLLDAARLEKADAALNDLTAKCEQFAAASDVNPGTSLDELRQKISACTRTNHPAD